MAKEYAAITDELLKNFACRQCGHREARAKQHYFVGEMAKEIYAFLACKQCGLCDIYNIELLAEARRKPGLIKKLIGTTSRY